MARDARRNVTHYQTARNADDRQGVGVITMVTYYDVIHRCLLKVIRENICVNQQR